MDRRKLETAIEKNTYKFVTMIKESASDAVMLWANKNRVDVDTVLLQRILDQYKVALESEYLSKSDLFMKGLDKDLEAFSGQENPLLPTEEQKVTRKKAKKA